MMLILLIDGITPNMHKGRVYPFLGKIAEHTNVSLHTTVIPSYTF
jgi:hypothetical protein